MIVAIQECEKMNGLLHEIRFSLTELDQGLDGALNITDSMEGLGKCLEINVLPPTWVLVTNPTKKTLQEWFIELLDRIIQLQEWTDNIETPAVLWISALFNPMSYLTAIMQVTARAENLPLDGVCLCTTVKNTFSKEDFPTFATSGVSSPLALSDQATLSPAPPPISSSTLSGCWPLSPTPPIIVSPRLPP